MKKRYFSFIILVVIQIIVLVGCSNSDSISSGKEKDIKEAIDLVLSYENGYDETMKKHISEKNFYVCNYKEYYSLYIGDATIEEYESKVVNTSKDGEKYKVYMLLNIKARGLEVHKNEDGSEEGSDEAIGEDIPLEVIVKEKDGEFYIEGLTEYENLEKAKELNEGFK